MINIPDIVYAPDLDSPRIPGAVISMSGFAPLQRGPYGSVSLNDIVTLAVSDVTRAQTFRFTDGTVRLLYFRDANIAEHVAGSGYTALGGPYTSGGKWDAAAWGNVIIATNYLDAPLKSSTKGGGLTSLGGTPPKARYIAVNQNFVMLADTDDSVSGIDDSGTYSDMVWWSGISNHETWAPSGATQADNFRLRDTPGPIVKLVAFRDRFVAFKSNSVYVGEFVGPPFGFVWRLVSSRVGLSASDGVCELDSRLYFVHDSGFYEFDGANMQNVGLPVWHTFLNQSGFLDIPRSGALGQMPSPGSGQEAVNLSECQAVGDDIEGVVWLSAYSTAVLNGRYRMYLYGYNVRSRKWANCGAVIQNVSAKPVFVRTTFAEMRTFNDQNFGAADEQGRVWIVDNAVSDPAVQELAYPAPWDNVGGSVMTALQGTPDRSTTAVRIYTRCIEGSSDSPFQTAAIYGYTNEQRTLGAQTAACTVNDEFESWDGQLNARFKQAYITGESGKTCLLAGVGIEYAPQGAR